MRQVSVPSQGLDQTFAPRRNYLQMGQQLTVVYNIAIGQSVKVCAQVSQKHDSPVRLDLVFA